MINFRLGRIATAAAILTVLASSAAFPAAACPLDPVQPAPNGKHCVLRLTAAMSVTPHRLSTRPVRQLDWGWRTRPAVHSGALTSKAPLAPISLSETARENRR
jgi:hypothetical protein